MSLRCTTHFHACDCREEKFKQIEKENEELREALKWCFITMRKMLPRMSELFNLSTEDHIEEIRTKLNLDKEGGK